MQKADSPRSKWWNTIFFLTAALVVVADQLSKLWIRSNLLVGQSLFEVGFFRFTHVHNTGAAFGIFQGYSSILTIVAFIGVAVLLTYTLFIHPRFPLLNGSLSRLALGLVLGGTIGNIIDRLRQGYVTDFIDIGVWPTFNLADSSVVVGAIMFAYVLLPLARAGKESDDR